MAKGDNPTGQSSFRSTVPPQTSMGQTNSTYKRDRTETLNRPQRPIQPSAMNTYSPNYAPSYNTNGQPEMQAQMPQSAIGPSMNPFAGSQQLNNQFQGNQSNSEQFYPQELQHPIAPMGHSSVQQNARMNSMGIQNPGSYKNIQYNGQDIPMNEINTQSPLNRRPQY